MKISYLVVTLAALLATESAFALRCGTNLINRGDPQIRVLKLCGEPVTVQSRVIFREGLPSPRRRYMRDTSNYRRSTDDELLLHNKSIVEVQIEEWVYNFGPNRLMKQIRFEDGRVVSIDGLGYGFN